jgi:hypothetical protein
MFWMTTLRQVQTRSISPSYVTSHRAEPADGGEPPPFAEAFEAVNNFSTLD